MEERKGLDVSGSERQIAERIASSVGHEERQVLMRWIERMNAIMSSDVGYVSKSVDAVSATCSSDL